MSAVDRIVLVARLKPGERERAEKLLADGVEPIVPDSVDRWTIFLSEGEVVFVFEGEGARESVLATLDDPVLSAAPRALASALRRPRPSGVRGAFPGALS